MVGRRKRKVQVRNKRKTGKYQEEKRVVERNLPNKTENRKQKQKTENKNRKRKQNRKGEDDKYWKNGGEEVVHGENGRLQSKRPTLDS